MFGVETNGKVSGLFSIPLPETGLSARPKEIPSGLALSADSKRLFVVLNLSNRLLELDAMTGKQMRLFNVGFAPCDVVLAGGKAYVRLLVVIAIIGCLLLSCYLPFRVQKNLLAGSNV